MKSRGVGTYDLAINMTDSSNNNAVHTEQNFIRLTDKPTQTGTGQTGTLEIDPIVIYIIIGIIGIAIIGSILIKKKKSADTLASIDRSLIVVDERTANSGKRRERVIGASSVGKASGLEAELKHKKNQEDEAPKPAVKPKKSSITDRLKEPSVKTIDLDQKKKQGEKIPETEEDISALLSSKPVSNMQMKQQEQSLDLDRKAAFLESKINGLNQNLVISTMILEQTKQSTIKEKECNFCGYSFPDNDIECPQCALNNIDQNSLNQKLKQAHPIGIKSICKICRKVLEDDWTECPYCLSNSK
jgi:predicted Zn-ribbon and HTH transcriptional regulator